MKTSIRKLRALPLLLLLSPHAFGLAIVCSDEPVTTLDTPASSARVIWTYYDYWYSSIFTIGETLVEQAVPALNAYSDADLFSPTDAEFRVAGYPADWGMDSYLNIGCVGSEAGDADEETESKVTDSLDTISETLIL